ncbi:MAG: MFS transporter [Pseudomonadales bacterium]|nr:MFS transporter [Pseudomonadales bacterium]MCP5184846.1 MFS transporter [Pseudomonadales bacterium]
MTERGTSQRERRHAERRFQLDVSRHLTRNFITHLIHGMLGQTGFRLLNAPTFLPAYMLLLSGGSDVMVGLALGLQSLGATLTPFYGAGLVENRPRALPVAMWVGSATRLQVLLIAVAGLLLPTSYALATIMVALTLFGMFQGMQGVIFQFLMSKVIPVSRRGRLTGLRNFSSGITAAGVAYLGGLWFVGDNPTVTGYSYIFLLAFVLTSLGLGALLFMREPLLPGMDGHSAREAFWPRVLAILRSNADYRRFVRARTVATAGRLAMPFYILYAAEHTSLTGANLAILTIAFTLAGNTSNLLWGNLADRTGYRLVILLSLGLWVLSTLALFLADGLWATSLIFVGIGAASQGFQNAASNIVLEFGERQDVPMRLAISNSTSEAAGTLATLSGGVLASAFGYEAVFGVSLVLLVTGGLMIRRFVPEPRGRLPSART